MKSKFITVFFLSLVCLCNAQTVYLYTPKGSQVYAFQPSEMSPSDIAYYTAGCASVYPNAEILSNATATYNCHSYAWNIAEGGTTICWLNQDPDLHRYWDDGSYEETTEAEAEKVFYYNGDHSAVKSITHGGKYESKWGKGPLVRHSPEYGPDIYNMQYRRYYRKSLPPAHCENCRQDGDELGLDCGGSCPPCEDAPQNRGIIQRNLKQENYAMESLFTRGSIILNGGKIIFAAGETMRDYGTSVHEDGFVLFFF